MQWLSKSYFYEKKEKRNLLKIINIIIISDLSYLIITKPHICENKNLVSWS